MAKTKQEIIAERSRNLRYKRPALALLGYEPIMTELDAIIEACNDIRYAIDNDESGDILESMLDDEEEVWEFNMAFASLSDKADEVNSAIRSGV